MNTENKAKQTPIKTKIETKINGVKTIINTAMLDDIDTLYLLHAANKGDVFAALDIIELVIGRQTREKLVDTLRDETGHAPVARLAELIQEIFAAIPKS